MAKDKEKDKAELEYSQLRDALESQAFRDILWREVIEPSCVLKAYSSNEPLANARFLAKAALGNRLMENIKAANLEAWFQMIRDNQFEEDVAEAEAKKLEASEGATNA